MATSSLDVEVALAAWRNRLREVLSSDPEGITGGRRPAAANHISNTFPDQDVLEAYTRPLCSLRKGPCTPEPMLTLPDLARIAKLCEQYFEWATPGNISDKFSMHVWPGAILRMILADITAAEASPVSSFILIRHFTILTTYSGLRHIHGAYLSHHPCYTSQTRHPWHHRVQGCIPLG